MYMQSSMLPTSHQGSYKTETEEGWRIGQCSVRVLPAVAAVRLCLEQTACSRQCGCGMVYGGYAEPCPILPPQPFIVQRSADEGNSGPREDIKDGDNVYDERSLTVELDSGTITLGAKRSRSGTEPLINYSNSDGWQD